MKKNLDRYDWLFHLVKLYDFATSLVCCASCFQFPTRTTRRNGCRSGNISLLDSTYLIDQFPDYMVSVKKSRMLADDRVVRESEFGNKIVPEHGDSDPSIPVAAVPLDHAVSLQMPRR